MATLGEKLKQLMALRRISQVETGRRMGLPAQSVYAWANDRIRPNLNSALQLARLFEVRLDWLADDTQGMEHLHRVDEVSSPSPSPPTVTSRVKVTLEFEANAMILARLFGDGGQSAALPPAIVRLKTAEVGP